MKQTERNNMSKMLKFTDGLCKVASALALPSLVIAVAVSFVADRAMPSPVVTALRIAIPAAVGYLVLWLAIRKSTSEILSRKRELAERIAIAAENHVNLENICEGIAQEAETLMGFANAAEETEEENADPAAESEAGDGTPASSGIGNAIASLFGMSAPELKKSIKQHVKKHIGSFSRSAFVAVVRKHANVRKRVSDKIMSIDFKQKLDNLSERFAFARVLGFALGLLAGLLLAVL